MMLIRWEPITHHRGAVCHDITGIGRYVVRRQAKGSRLWVLVLNNKEIGLFNDRADAIKAGEITIRGHA